ncbi:MAG: SMP-30/gluconolactonase/LRE family protein [Leptospiraceae bacterium]|nr:SMP-30/gluconolactonase/LRE family protein [Leptospiraceae bacterium]MCP5510351.1 SMP-30/gluconolactonase/LRE family protein [Leptospiraceae bacterium]
MSRIFFYFCLFLFFSIQPTSSEDLPDFRIGKESARSSFKKGILQLNNYQYGAAKESFLTSLSVMEDFHLARKMLSDAYFLAGEWQESLNELEILERRKVANQIWKNRAEILRLNIAGIGKKDGLTFFKHISGDDHRGFRFRNPTDVVVDSDGFMYVLGFETKNVVKFDPNGFPVGNFKGGLGRTFEGPMSFSLHNDVLYVSDFASDRIYKLSQKGQFMDRFGESGIGPGQFHGPTGLDVSSGQHLYVSDSGNNRIQKLNLDGTFLHSFPLPKAKFSEKLFFPAGLTIKEDGQIYVADKGNSRIAVFDDEGNYIKQLTHPNMKKPRSVKFYENRMYVADEANGLMIYNPIQEKWTKISTFRDASGDYVKMLKPFSSAYDYTGSLYSVDFARHRIDIFSPKNSLSSNLNVFVERVELSRFPTISLFLRVKNRSNQDLKGIRREAFRIFENSNIHPLVGLANMKEYNDQITVSLVYENSQKLKELSPNMDLYLGNFFSSITTKDRIEVIRAGKDAEKVYDYGNSPLDIYAKIRKSVPDPEFINLGKSLFQAISDLTPELGPRAVIMVVSGETLPNAFNQYSILRNIQYANAHSIPIIILSMGDEGEMVDVYKDIATRTRGAFLKVPGSQKEVELYNFIKSKKDNRYIVSFKSKTDEDLAGRYIDYEISVFFREIIGKAQGGYFVPENN